MREKYIDIACLVEIDSLDDYLGRYNGHTYIASRKLTHALFSYWINNLMSLVRSDETLSFIAATVNR